MKAIGAKSYKADGRRTEYFDLVLAAGTETVAQDRLSAALLGKGSRRLHVPITIIPGSMTVDQIDAITWIDKSSPNYR